MTLSANALQRSRATMVQVVYGNQVNPFLYVDWIRNWGYVLQRGHNVEWCLDHAENLQLLRDSVDADLKPLLHKDYLNTIESAILRMVILEAYYYGEPLDKLKIAYGRIADLLGDETVKGFVLSVIDRL